MIIRDQSEQSLFAKTSEYVSNVWITPPYNLKSLSRNSKLIPGYTTVLFTRY